MIRLKSKNVNLDNVSSDIYYAISIVAEIYETIGAGDLVITSVRDSKHSNGSLHYVGEAFDTRVWTIPKTVNMDVLIKTIKSQLGNTYDVIFETTHIHIEYDPK